jgi:hypothetical protein
MAWIPLRVFSPGRFIYAAGLNSFVLAIRVEIDYTCIEKPKEVLHEDSQSR